MSILWTFGLLLSSLLCYFLFIILEFSDEYSLTSKRRFN